LKSRSLFRPGRGLRACCSFLSQLLLPWLCIAGLEKAVAGAWLMPEGEGQAICYSEFSDSCRAFDARGRLVPVRDYRKFELGAYVEYGLADWLTVVLSPAYDRIHSPLPRQSYSGIGQSEAAARVRIFQNESSVVSFQAGVRSAGASFADSLGPLEVKRSASFELRALAGKSATILGMESFADVEAAYRFYGGNQSGELRLDLSAGIRPSPSLLLMLQSFTSIERGSKLFAHQSWTKLQPSFVYQLGPQWWIQLGGFLTVSGVNAGRELGPIGGIWFRF